MDRLKDITHARLGGSRVVHHGERLERGKVSEPACFRSTATQPGAWLTSEESQGGCAQCVVLPASAEKINATARLALGHELPPIHHLLPK